MFFVKKFPQALGICGRGFWSIALSEFKLSAFAPLQHRRGWIDFRGGSDDVVDGTQGLLAAA
jgi:hypothetical protein